MKDGLIIRNVSHWMGEGEAHACVLAPLDHDFRPGRLCCVSGPSGTGKTTLLSILAAVVRPTHGRVLHAGIDLARATDRARLDWRRRELGLVFQTSRLIDVLTTAEHMALVARLRRAAVETMGVAWLHKLGLGHRLNNRPSALSGGEKQRVALAQALAPGPTILLADEPTAALDSTNASLVARVLADYAAQTNAVVVAVSHDPILLDAADDRIDLCRP